MMRVMIDTNGLRAHAQAELDRWSVPALELVAVKAGEVVLADAFGLRDVATGLPATPNTLFHFGSTGKAFTGVLAGTLVDAGLLEWDRPVREYLPDLRLHESLLGDRITTADLLSHRSGLPRHEFSWVLNPSWSRAELVRRLRYLPSSTDIRTTFGYSNLAYTTVGHLIGVLTNSSWEEQMHERVLAPLGMGRTVTSVDAAQAAEHAQPYLVTPPAGETAPRDGATRWTSIPWRQSDAIAPAGGIMTCAVDAARWLRMQLGGGEVDGTRVISSDALARTHRLHTPIDAPGHDERMWFYGYAFGWLVGTYRGKKLLWHNGGIDGFHTDIALLPDDGIGAAACSSVLNSSLPISIVFHTLDVLLGVEPKPWGDELFAAQENRPTPPEPARVEGTQPSHTLDVYAGEYTHPGYGSLVVSSDGNALRVCLGEFDLDTRYRHYDTWTVAYPPLEEGWSLTFLHDADGAIAAAEMPLEPTLAPIRFERVRDETEETTEKAEAGA
jgi:CubicO group peptidase (beta-lactamase class C family)